VSDNKIPSMEVGKFTTYSNGDKTISVYREGKFLCAIENTTASGDLIYKTAREIEQLEQENAKLKEQLKDANDKFYVIANTATDIDTFALEQSFRKKSQRIFRKI